VQSLHKKRKEALDDEDYDLAKQFRFECEVNSRILVERPKHIAETRSPIIGLRHAGLRPEIDRVSLYQCAMTAQTLAKIVGYITVDCMPVFRRVSKLLRGVLQAQLSCDRNLTRALENHTLILASQSSKQPWVAVRVRPGLGNGFSVSGRSVSVKLPHNPYASHSRQSEDFFFDEVFDGSVSQLELWSCLEMPLMRCVAAHQHACVLAYGQTGSGKTYTMFGNTPDDEGVALRVVRRVASMLRREFERNAHLKNSLTIEFSFMEIYNECIFDLLDKQRQLQCMRQTAAATVPQGLTKLQCAVPAMEARICAWLKSGAGSRTVGETLFNPSSSRSHAVATVYLNWHPNLQSRIYLVDLAGSERCGKYALSSEQLREGNSINHGLAVLGRVVSAIAQGRGDHVPLRDSTLTWLLSDAITAHDGRAFMFATVSPASLAETISTLRYARQFSNLKAKGGAEVTRLGKCVRSLDSQLSALKREYAELANKCRTQDKAWTQQALLKGGVRVVADARGMVDAHPLLEWTPMHARISPADIGSIRVITESPQLRDEGDVPDGRITAPPMELLKLLPRRVAATPRTTAARTPRRGGASAPSVVEVVFEGSQKRPSVVLWYPEAALERVEPPRWLEPLTSLARKVAAAEEKLKSLREEMASAKALHTVSHQRLLDQAHEPSLNDF
jgi:hypothetical protein